MVDKNFVADASAFKTWMTGKKFVYTLATPITYHLTPTQIRLLLGANNIWADTGNVLSLEYPIDTKTYIDEELDTFNENVSNHFSNVENDITSIETYINATTNPPQTWAELQQHVQNDWAKFTTNIRDQYECSYGETTLLWDEIGVNQNTGNTKSMTLYTHYMLRDS